MPRADGAGSLNSANSGTWYEYISKLSLWPVREAPSHAGSHEEDTESSSDDTESTTVTLLSSVSNMSWWMFGRRQGPSTQSEASDVWSTRSAMSVTSSSTVGSPQAHPTVAHGAQAEEDTCSTPADPDLAEQRAARKLWLPGGRTLGLLAKLGCLAVFPKIPIPLRVLRGRMAGRLAVRVCMVWGGAVAWRRVSSITRGAVRRARHQHLDGPAQASEGARPNAALLGLPHAAWLTEDVCVRLLAQTGGDNSKAREKAATINAWREQHGLNHLRLAPPGPPRAPPKQAANRWLGHHRPQREHTPHGSQAPAPRHGPASEAAAAVRRFGAVSRILGITLLYADNDAGNAILWIRCSCLVHVHKALDDLLSAESPGPGPVSPSAWLRAITLHIALMSDWLWSMRLPGRPLHAGRMIQVIDLKGAHLGSLIGGEGAAILRAVMAAAHNYPQRLASSVVIHPPPGLALAWSLVSKLLPAPIVSKIRIVRGSSKVVAAELKALVPGEFLPAAVGGPRGDLSELPVQREVEAAMAGCTWV